MMGIVVAVKPSITFLFLLQCLSSSGELLLQPSQRFCQWIGLRKSNLFSSLLAVMQALLLKVFGLAYLFFMTSDQVVVSLLAVGYIKYLSFTFSIPCTFSSVLLETCLASCMLESRVIVSWLDCNLRVNFPLIYTAFPRTFADLSINSSSLGTSCLIKLSRLLLFKWFVYCSYVGFSFN